MLLLLLVASLLLLVLLILFIKHQYSYWQRRGFPYDANYSIPFGCLGSVCRREKSMGMAIYDVYQKSKERFIGVYLLYRPGVVVCDAELARRVLAQDFAHFHDRGVYVDEEKDPLSASLFSMRGKSWRDMRHSLAPSFTSGKLKAMFSTSEDIGNKMVAYLNTIIPKGSTIEVDLKEMLTTYAIDIIASVIFGLEINSYEQPNNKFRNFVTITRRNTMFNAIVQMLIFLCPPVAKLITLMGFKNETAVGLRGIIKDTIEYREKHNIVRKDMLQLLMQLRNTGKIEEDDNNWSAKVKTGDMKPISLDLIAAQAFIFYIAGQETTASTSAFTIFELAQYPELLARAQQEVEDTLRECNGQITYETLKQMEFIERCLLETIRKYPGLPMLNRECTQDYHISGTDHIIEKGTPILISLLGIHRDPAYFPEPEKYDPERFLPSQSNYNATAYMPFGEGPRHCIAQRMGMVNSKLAVVKILHHFNIEIMDKREIEIDNHSVGIIPKGGVKVRLSRKRSNAEQ